MSLGFPGLCVISQVVPQYMYIIIFNILFARRQIEMNLNNPNFSLFAADQFVR